MSIYDRMNDAKFSFTKLQGVDISELKKLWPDLDASDLKKLKEYLKEYTTKFKSRKQAADFMKTLNIQDILNDD